MSRDKLVQGAVSEKRKWMSADQSGQAGDAGATEIAIPPFRLSVEPRSNYSDGTGGRRNHPNGKRRMNGFEQNKANLLRGGR